MIFANRTKKGAYHSWQDPTATDDEDGAIPRYMIILCHGIVYHILEIICYYKEDYIIILWVFLNGKF